MTTYREGLIARLRSSANDVAWVINAWPDDRHEWSPEAEWSAQTVLTHLRDFEHGSALARLRQMVLDDVTSFDRFDAAGWRGLHRDFAQSPDDLLDDFRAGRREVTGLLSRMDDGDWDSFAKLGPFPNGNVERVAELVYAHTLDHLQQLIALRWRAIGAAPPRQ